MPLGTWEVPVAYLIIFDSLVITLGILSYGGNILIYEAD